MVISKYCKKCAEKYGWPIQTKLKQGMCSYCGDMTECCRAPSGSLKAPVPPSGQLSLPEAEDGSELPKERPEAVRKPKVKVLQVDENAADLSEPVVPNSKSRIILTASGLRKAQAVARRKATDEFVKITIGTANNVALSSTKTMVDIKVPPELEAAIPDITFALDKKGFSVTSNALVLTVSW
jgi:hypothetical protein